MNCSNCGMNYQSDSIIEVDGDSVFCAKCAVKRLESKLVSAKQRELELLAAIEKIKNQTPYGWFDTACGQMFFSRHEREATEIPLYTNSDLTHEPSQALREHEAKILEEAAEVFEIIGYAKFKTPADELRRMAEERRNNG